jgi:hypothetical protein
MFQLQISPHQVDFRYTKRKYRGEASLYSGAKYNNITTKNRVIWLKLMHNYVTELLRFNHSEAVTWVR